MEYSKEVSFAKNLDEHDSLKHFRSSFSIPQHLGRDCIYFTGNSLGLQPKKAREYISQELDDWASLGVEGHFHARHPWYSYHETFPPHLSAIVGCMPEEVVVMNQLTVNLHLLMASFYRPTSDRYKIICEAKAFPSDQYAMESQVRFHGFDPNDAIIEVSPRAGYQTIQPTDILNCIQMHGKELSMVLFGAVNYYSGQFFDLPGITKAAHDVGAYAGFDLAHAAGNVKMELHDWDIDFGCWCSYKYLNSGPGGVGGAFIHKKHVTNSNIPRLAGWWGYDKDTRFQMKKGFSPIPTAEGWQLSNAPILSMAVHKAALEIFSEAGMDQLDAKGKKLSEYMIFLLDNINISRGEKVIEIITPRNENERGCQLSMLMLKNGTEIFNELHQQGIIVDWREPNVIRVAPVPLYNTFEEVWKFADILESILNRGG